DIGEWFPSGDERWRGASSTKLLNAVWKALTEEGWRLANADLTIVASEPRIAPFRARMRQALARALECPVEQVSLKASTTDGLGALGRAEGVLALATVLLERT